MAFRTAGEPVGNVGSGIDCFLMQDNSILGYSTNLNLSEDFMLEGIQTLGYYGYRNFMSMGYSCEFSLGTFLLRGANVADALSIAGWQPDGTCNINSSGYNTFTGFDVHTLSVLFTIVGAKYSGGELSVAQGELMKRSTKWKSRFCLPGLQTS